MMYKRHLNQINLLDEPEYFGGIALDPDNEWVKLAKLIPWHQFEEEYATSFPPYLQFFIGLEAFTHKSPFDQSMMTRFRKRISTKTLQEVNDIIIGRPKEKEDQDDNGNGGKGNGGGNSGTLILDATCAPQNIRFPTDGSLLNEARLNAEEIIDVLHEQGLTDGNKKPRTYREKAKRQYNSFSKSRKKSRKSIRQTIRRQLGYLKRDLAIIEQIAKKHPDYAEYLPQWLKERLQVIRLLYSQQQEMYSTNTHRVENRIVSLSQPWVRPVVRGKQNAEVEFGAKVEMSDVNGYLRIEDLRWDAFNESTTFQKSVENYRKAYGYYPERVLADTIFRTRENLRYCKEHGIHLNGPRLGKPASDPAVRKQERYLEWLESGERGDIERRFGINKRCYSLGCITAKLQHTSEVMILMSVLTLNLQRRLRLLLRAFFRFYLEPQIMLLVQ